MLLRCYFLLFSLSNILNPGSFYCLPSMPGTSKWPVPWGRPLPRCCTLCTSSTERRTILITPSNAVSKIGSCSQDVQLFFVLNKNCSSLFTSFSKHRPSGSGPSKCPSVDGHFNGPEPEPCVCLFFRVFNLEEHFKRLFAPNSRSRMSKVFRDSEYFGESKGKNWSQI